MIELLSPAGSPEAVIAAVQNGADAIYMGLGNFNARRGAKNFTDEEFERSMRYCRIRGCKVYVTLNTLVNDREIAQAVESARLASQLGADGIIIQDLGLAYAIRQALPDIPLHASTQMSIHNLAGVEAAAEMGMTRAVLARELSLEQIKFITQHASIETEVFVHGALCFCQSGQCYMSALIGRRSGNRGMCAQPCRMQYSLGGRMDDYPMSLKDNCLVDRLRELEDAGVACLKIEGRMKRPEYVAAAVSQFRQALLGAQADMDLMAAVFSRSGFTQGYFDGRLGLDMFGTRQKEDVLAGQKVLKSLSDLASKDVPRVGVDFSFSMQQDQPVVLTANDREGHTVSAQGEVPQAALKAPTNEELVRRSLEKTGGTFYYLNSLETELGEGLICPASQLNALRRQALEQLTEQRGQIVPIGFEPVARQSKRGRSPVAQPALRAQIRQMSQLTDSLAASCEQIILPLDEVLRHAAELDKSLLPKLAVSLPRVVFGDDAAQLTERLNECRRMGIEHLSVGNLGGVYLGRQLGFTLHGEFGLNIANEGCLQEYEKLGLADCLLSFELSLSRAKAVGGLLPRGLLIYGRLPLMVTRNCPIRLSGCRDCKGFGTLTDRKKEVFEVRCSGRKYSEIFNSRPVYLADRMEELSGFDYGLLYFTSEGPKQVDRILREYTILHEPMEQITRGLYYRNVK